MTPPPAAQRASLALGGVAAALLLIELALRASNLWMTFLYRSHRVEPDPAALRVLIVGESTSAPTRDHGVDRSWPAQLEALLEKVRPGLDVQIVNMAVGGTNSDALLERLPAYLERHKPALVLAMMGVNDPTWYGLGSETGVLSRFKVTKLIRFFYHEGLLRGLRGGREAADPQQLVWWERNYRELKRRVDAAGAKLVAIQYPMMDAGALGAMFPPGSGVPVILNDDNFTAAVATRGYDALFLDRFRDVWGHCTTAGNSLIAERAANRLLALEGVLP